MFGRARIDFKGPKSEKFDHPFIDDCDFCRQKSSVGCDAKIGENFAAPGSYPE
jgi:hypothetical protein